MPLDEVLYPVDERGCRISTPDSEDPDMERERPRRACTACSPLCLARHTPRRQRTVF